MGVPKKAGLHLDATGAFIAGMNSDVPAILLPKNQLSFATNGTVRGGFFTNRPPFVDLSLTFNGSSQTLFETKLFQGCCYYKPDYGNESIVASIGGRLFQVTPTISGFTAEVSDITPASGGASDSLGIAWLWQSERWVIRQDGQATPMFFDGNTSRYAKTGDEVVGTVAAQVTIQGTDTAFAVTLTAAGFSGQYGKTYNVKTSAGDLIGRFQVSQYTAPTDTTVRLTNLSDTPGLNHALGEQINITKNYQGTSTNSVAIAPGAQAAVNLTPQFTGAIGSILFWNTAPYQLRVIAINGSAVTLQNLIQFQMAIQVGQPFGMTPSLPNSLVGTTAAAFIAPALNGTVDVQIDTPYSGVDGQYVNIGGALYSIARATPADGATSIFLTNINAPAGVIPAGATINELPELPVGRMGAYGLGRNWMSLPDGASYIGSDIVGSSSGSPAEKFRDSVLNITENNYLSGGGVFRIPVSGQQINAMRFPATLDSSLGQGPLQVLTQNMVFSCNAPVQRSTWQDLTNPIQTQSLIGGGALAQESTVAVNGDLWFRSIDGIRSLKLARQDFFTSYGNTPQSVEMNRTILADDKRLLAYGSAKVFDNRLLMTAAPAQAGGGVYHTSLIALNLDPISSLREKTPPVYDGVWQNRNILALVVGTFNSVERCFAFIYDTTALTIGLTEIIPSETSVIFDDDSDRIRSSYESPALFYQPDTATRELLRLDDGEIIIKDLVGDVRFDVYYRPDYDQNWHSWHSWEVTDTPSWQPRMGLGSPDYKQGDTETGRPFAVGYSFQVKVVITGSCRVLGMNFYAVTQEDTTRMKPKPRLTPLGNDVT